MPIHHFDTFTAPDSTLLSAHTPEIGGGYSSSGPATGPSGFHILSNVTGQTAVNLSGAVRSNALHGLGQAHVGADIWSNLNQICVWSLFGMASPTVFFNESALGYEIRANYIPAPEDKSLKLYYRDSTQEVLIATLIASPNLVRPTVFTPMALEVRDNGNGSVRVKAFYDGTTEYDQDHTPDDPSIIRNRSAGFATFHRQAYLDNFLVEDLGGSGQPALHYARPI